MQHTQTEVNIRSIHPQMKEKTSNKSKLVFRSFVQTPNEVVKEGQRSVFSEMWTRRCGNP